MNFIICDDLYIYIEKCTPIILRPLLKGVCDIPLVVLTLRFHDLHPFIIVYTSTPSVYTHSIFNSGVKLCKAKGMVDYLLCYLRLFLSRILKKVNLVTLLLL